MSFVKDDSSHTRGVGAIAAMDAVSSRRRAAAALGALRMAQRDGVMARHTLGRISQTEPSDGGGGGGGVPTGGGSRPPGPGRPRPGRPRPGRPLPPKPVPPKTPPKFIGIRDLVGPRRDLMVGVRGDFKTPDGGKLPGSQIVEVTPTPTPPKDQVLPPPPPPKSTTVIVGSGQTPIVGGGRPAPSPGGGGFPGFDPEPEVDVSVQPAPAAEAAKPASNKMLLYAALGIGALWLLTRKD